MRFSPRKEILHHVWSVYRLFTCSSYCTSNSIILQRQIRLMRSWHDKQVKIKKIKEKSWTTWKYVTDLKFFRWRSLLRYSSLQKKTPQIIFCLQNMVFPDCLSATFKANCVPLNDANSTDKRTEGPSEGPRNKHAPRRCSSSSKLATWLSPKGTFSSR